MIYDTEHRRVMRANVIEDLATLAAPDEQLKFQRDVPFVNISVELVCNWFDGHYFPDDTVFVAQFSEAEWKAVTEFSNVFADVTSKFDDVNYPEIEELLQRPDWARVIEAAKIALVVFEEN